MTTELHFLHGLCQPLTSTERGPTIGSRTVGVVKPAHQDASLALGHRIQFSTSQTCKYWQSSSCSGGTVFAIDAYREMQVAVQRFVSNSAHIHSDFQVTAESPLLVLPCSWLISTKECTTADCRTVKIVKRTHHCKSFASNYRVLCFPYSYLQVIKNLLATYKVLAANIYRDTLRYNYRMS